MYSAGTNVSVPLVFLSLCLLLAPVAHPYGPLRVCALPGPQVGRVDMLEGPMDSVPIVLDGDEGLRASGLPGSGTASDPFVIAGLRVESPTYCLRVSDTTEHVVVRRCLFRSYGMNGSVAVLLLNVTNVVVEECTVIGGMSGLVLAGASGCTVRGCRMVDAQSGIWATGSSDCVFSGNAVYHNDVGVLVNTSSLCRLTHNRVYGNRVSGVALGPGTTAISVYDNMIGWNGRGRGPTPTSWDATDDGVSNVWDDGVSRGNNWTVAAGAVVPIRGSAGSADRFPSLLRDRDAPRLSSAPDLLFVEGSGYHSIAWAVDDPFVLTYRLGRDGAAVESGTLVSPSVNVTVSDLPRGRHYFSLTVVDAAGNAATGHITVTVLEDIFARIVSPYVLLASLLSVVCVVCVLVVVHRFRPGPT